MKGKNALKAVATAIGAAVGGPFGALLGAGVDLLSKPTGVKDIAGNLVSKSPLQSTTILGGLGLAGVTPIIFPLIDEALPWPQVAAAVKVAVVLWLLGVVVRGRKQAKTPVGDD